jgi:Fe-S-cluster-containing hydrogenase component 2
MEDRDLSNTNCDILVLGFPKFYGYVPLFYLDYVKETLNTSVSPSKVILYCTESGGTLTSFTEMISILEEKNYHTVWAQSIIMPNNYLIKSNYEPTSMDIAESRIENISSLVETIVSSVLNRNKHIEEADEEKAQRARTMAYSLKEKAGMIASGYSVDETCTFCDECIKICPTSAIVKSGNKYSFTDNCINCVRCVNICSSNSIIYNQYKPPQYKMLLEIL